MSKFFDIIKKYSVPIFIVYLLVLILVLILKFPSPIFGYIIEQWKSGADRVYLEKPHLVPFEIITYYVKSTHSINDWFFKNLACNIIMFMPFGFLVPLFSKKKKWWQILLFGILLSVLIEVIQHLLRIGIADIDDVILNGFGTILGFGIYKIIYSAALKNVLE